MLFQRSVFLQSRTRHLYLWRSLMPVKKAVPIIAALGAAVVASATTVLAVQIYQRPVELAFDMARLRLKTLKAREGTCEAGGLPMHYYRVGKGEEPVVMVHGLGGTGEAWVNLIPLLSRDFLIYAPDLPGFGKTPLAPGKQCISTHVEYLGYFLDALGYPQVTLVGQSLGGWIATRYTARHPEHVKRLYLLNSAGLMREGMFSPYTPDRDAAKKYIERMIDYRGPVPNFLLDAIVKVSREPAYAEFIANYDRAEEVDDILGEITTPTTIIWGTKDRIFPLSCAYDFHEGIRNSRLVLAPGVSHNTQVGAAKMIAKIMREDARNNLQ
jgi:pimeloyl-ACP methyl ester carboxylesterase